MKNTRKRIKNKGGTKKSRVQKRTIVIGKIFADWCGHCNEMQEGWEKMKGMIKRDTGRKIKNTNFDIVEIGDTSENQGRGITVDQLLQQLNSKYFPKGDKAVVSNGFPTLFRIVNKKIEYYESSDRSTKALYKWYTH